MYTEQDNPQARARAASAARRKKSSRPHARSDDPAEDPHPKKTQLWPQRAHDTRRASPAPPSIPCKHGGCSRTLILEGESEDAWHLLHVRWCDSATKPPKTRTRLLYDFVRKTAQAEWFRIRCQHNYDLYVLSLSAPSPPSIGPLKKSKSTTSSSATKPPPNAPSIAKIAPSNSTTNSTARPNTRQTAIHSRRTRRTRRTLARPRPHHRRRRSR